MFSMVTPSYQQPIQGRLPFGGAGGGGIAGAASGNINSIVSDYNSAYNNALAMNQSNYNNILQGYQQAIASNTTAQQAISSGYNDLYNEVMGKLEGQGQAATRRINDSSAQFLSGQVQSQIDRGLGNTTITTSTARGVEADRQQRLQENDESIAKLMADYMSNLGTRRLEGARTGANQTTGLQLNQLDFMNSVQSKYPDAGMYAQLAQMAAAAGRGDEKGAGGGMYGGGAFAGAGPAPKLGYVPGGTPYYGGGGYTPPPSAGGSFNLFSGGMGGGGFGDFNYGGAAASAGGGMGKLPVDYSSFYGGAGRDTFGGAGYGTTTPVDYGYGADPSLWGY